MRNARRGALLLCLGALPAFAARRRATVVCENGAETMLTCLASKGKVRLVRQVLDHGTPPGQPDSGGATALHWAARTAHNDVVRLLLKRRAPVAARNRQGGTPLHWAANGGNEQTAQLLMNAGADPNALNNQALSPLMIAANTGDKAVARVLLARHARVDLRSAAGLTAWDMATARGHRDIAMMILSASRPPPRPAPRPAPGAAAAPPPAAAPPVSKAEMERMIDEAVRKAAGAPAGAPAPARAKTSDVDKPRYSVSENPDNYAVVVGIEHYSDIPEAEFAEHDAAAVREHLAALGFPQRNIVSLVGPKATKTGLVKTLETWLPQNVNPRSTVFVYYSGHGAPDPKSGRSYLVPWDGDPQFLDDTAYPVQRLYEKLGALKAKRVVVALDSCFSGAGGRSVIAAGLRPLVTKIDPSAVPARVIALTASGPDQVSRSLAAQGHGLFTYYLLRGLNGDAQDDRTGAVTVAALYKYLKPKVQDEARRASGDQTPQMIPVSADASLRLR